MHLPSILPQFKYHNKKDPLLSQSSKFTTSLKLKMSLLLLIQINLTTYKENKKKIFLSTDPSDPIKLYVICNPNIINKITLFNPLNIKNELII